MISICSIWLISSILSFSFHSPTAITPVCPRLHTFISDPVVVQADFFYGLVDPNRVSKGLQSWHEAKAKWTADWWAFHCGCAELPALSTGSATCQDCHSCPLMSDPHITIQPTLFYTFHHICTVICFHLFSAVYRKVTHCKTFSTRSCEKHIQKPHAPSGKRIRFLKGQWTSKLLRLPSLQVDPPIHSTKSDVKVLAKTDSWKDKTHCSGPQEKGRTCENDFHLQYLIEFLYPVILLPQPRSRGPAAVFQPSRRRCQSGCRSGRLLLWFCWPATRRRGPAELARGKGQVDSRRVGVSLQHGAELPALSTGSSACQDYHSCPLMSDPHVTIQPTLFYTFHHICTVICFHLFSAVYRKVTHCNTISMKIHSQTTYPVQKEDKVPEGAVNLETLET